MFVDLVAEVEPALVILDSSELPESETRGVEDSEDTETDISSAGEIKYFLS